MHSTPQRHELRGWQSRRGATAVAIYAGGSVVVNDLVADFTKDDQGRWWRCR